MMMRRQPVPLLYFLLIGLVTTNTFVVARRRGGGSFLISPSSAVGGLHSLKDPLVATARGSSNHRQCKNFRHVLQSSASSSLYGGMDPYDGTGAPASAMGLESEFGDDYREQQDRKFEEMSNMSFGKKLVIFPVSIALRIARECVVGYLVGYLGGFIISFPHFYSGDGSFTWTDLTAKAMRWGKSSAGNFAAFNGSDHATSIIRGKRDGFNMVTSTICGTIWFNRQKGLVAMGRSAVIWGSIMALFHFTTPDPKESTYEANNLNVGSKEVEMTEQEQMEEVSKAMAPGSW